MMQPTVGEMIYIEIDRYTGDAIITYIDESRLHLEYFQQSNVKCQKEDLYKMEDKEWANHDTRVNLKDINCYNDLRVFMCQFCLQLYQDAKKNMRY